VTPVTTIFTPWISVTAAATVTVAFTTMQWNFLQELRAHSP
jgi:hypothetical protein